MLEGVEVVRRGKVRRAKLYYLRDRRGKSARIVENTNAAPSASTKKPAPKLLPRRQGRRSQQAEKDAAEAAANKAHRRNKPTPVYLEFF